MKILNITFHVYMKAMPFRTKIFNRNCALNIKILVKIMNITFNTVYKDSIHGIS